MKKISLFMFLCCLIGLCTLPALAQEQSLPVVRMSYAADAALSQETAVEAQVTLSYAGQDASFNAMLRLQDKTTDAAEAALPQKSLRVDGDAMRFILYNGGGDALYTKVMNAVCANLLAQSPFAVPVPTQAPVEVYLNGEYCGLYTRRETVEDAIARFESLDDTAALNVADGNKNAICGDASGLTEAFGRMKTLDLSRNEDRKTLSELLDTESFLNWMAVNTYFGNANLYGEIYFYQLGEGPWKCAAGDFAYALLSAQDNTVGRLVQRDEAQAPQSDTTILAGMLLKESMYRDAFLTKLGALYQTFTTPVMQAAADAENARIASALPAHMERWADAFAQTMSEKYGYPAQNAQEALLFQQYRVYRLRDKTLVRRPWYVYDSVQNELAVSDADMARYFGSPKPELPEVSGDTWESYKEANASQSSSDK